MIRKLLYILLTSALLFSCNKTKTIPEDKMALIIRDILVSNSYVVEKLSRTISRDSIDIYTPIFDKYGYKASDFQHTLDGMTTRKSSRFSQLIDQAIEEIRIIDGSVKFVVRQREYMDSIIISKYTDTVFVRDSLITITSKRNEMNVYSMAVKPGTYNVSFYYLIDSADNKAYRARRHIKDTLGRQVQSNFERLVIKGKKTKTAFSVTASPAADSLVLAFVNNIEQQKDGKIEIDSLVVSYYGPIDSLRRRMDEEILEGIRKGWSNNPVLYVKPEEDSCSLRILPPLWPDSTSCFDLRAGWALDLGRERGE